MSASAGTIEQAALFLGQALKGLADQLKADPARLISRLGAAPVEDLIAAGPLKSALANAATAIADLVTAIDALDVAINVGDSPSITLHGAESLTKIATAIANLGTIGSQLESAVSGSASLSPAQKVRFRTFAQGLPKRLLALAVIDMLVERHPALTASLNLLGLIDLEMVPGNAIDPTLFPAHVDRALRLDRLGQLLTQPLQALQSVFGFGTPAFDGLVLFGRLKTMLDTRHDLAQIVITDAGLNALQAPGFVLSVDARSSPPGLIIPLRSGLSEPFSQEFQLGGPWKFTFQRDGQYGAGALLQLSPAGHVAIIPPVGPATVTATARLTANRTGKPLLLLGLAEGTRLSAEKFELSIEIKADWDSASGSARAEPSFGFAFEQMKAVLDVGGSDGFLTMLIGSGGEFDLSFAGRFTPGRGLSFAGSSGLEVAIPLHADLGPVSIESAHFVGATQGGALALEFSVDVRGALGPMTAVINRVGVVLDATFPDTGGNLGLANLDVSFKPPDGVGLSLDAGGFKGGGFLLRDTAREEYGGGLELDFQGIVTVKAVGLLQTKFPDGHKGFSLVILLFTEFPPMQLGLGFTLLGVGGLLGLSRTVDEDALREGVHQGALDSVLFPRDVAANAPQIVNDLQRLFPPAEDHFLIGPMVKFGWGTPTILSLEFGLVLDIPRPGFLILGRLQIGLPFQDLPLFDIRVAFAGGMDFQSGQFWFDGTLHDSRLLTFALTGDMAVRLYWKENANFVLTVGGFHPAYTPPPMALGKLQRLGITIFDGNPLLRAETYFAITSNTVQWGAKAELFFGVKVFNVYGFIAYDVLIQFDPFRFVATLSATLAVRSGSEVLLGIRVDALVEGPTPWHAKGTGHFEISLIISITIDVDFEITLGDSRHDTLPAVPVLPKLADAFAQPQNWRAVIPAGTNLQVSLRAFEQPEGTPVLHPFGSLEITQKLAPLNLHIDKIGTQPISDGQLFAVEQVILGAAPAQLAPLREQFAPAQFIEMTDAQKLSRRSFEQYEAGVQVGGGDAVNADYVTGLSVEYEVIYMPEHRKRVFFALAGFLFDAFARAGAVCQSALSAAQKAPSELGTPRVNIAAEQFAVASITDLTLHDEKLVFASEAEAQAAMSQLVDRDPSLTREVQVIPLSLAKAA